MDMQTIKASYAGLANERKSTRPVSRKPHSPASRVARIGVPVSSITMPLPDAGFRRAGLLHGGVRTKVPLLLLLLLLLR